MQHFSYFSVSGSTGGPTERILLVLSSIHGNKSNVTVDRILVLITSAFYFVC